MGVVSGILFRLQQMIRSAGPGMTGAGCCEVTGRSPGGSPRIETGTFVSVGLHPHE